MAKEETTSTPKASERILQEIQDLKTTLTHKGGKETMSDFCPECMRKDYQADLVTRDHQHDLEKLAAERDKAEQQAEATKTELTNALKSLQHHIEYYPNGCQDGENCPTNQALHRIAENAKKNITPDDLTIDLIGEYFRKRGILGVGKQGGEYKPFKSIKTGGK